MAGRCYLAILFSFAAAAPPALADTYKWVDDKGVTNYSNKPPPGNAAKAQLVEERISVIGADPSVRHAAAAMHDRAARRAQYDEADYLQRLRIMAAQRGYAGTGPNCPYGTDCGTGYGASTYYPSYAYPYAGSVFVAAVPMRSSTVFTQRSFFLSGGSGSMRSGRGSSR